MHRAVPIGALVIALAACGRAQNGENSASVTSAKAPQGNGTGDGNGNRTGDRSKRDGEYGVDEAVDPAKLSVTVRVRGADLVVTGEKLLAVPRVAPPGEVESGTGWRVSTILGLAGVHAPTRIVLGNAQGQSLALDGAFGDLDERGAVPYVKLNRQGALRFRMYRKVGESWQSGDTLRDVTRIDVQ